MRRNRKRTNLFTQVPMPNVPRNYFDLSHELKMSAKFGYLYPIFLTECLPGDSFRDTFSVMARFAPMLAPVMHEVDITTHFFFAPARLLTDAWEDFITGGQDGDQEPVLPFVTMAGIAAAAGDGDAFQVGTLWDYLGLPPYDGVSPGWSTEQLSVLPFRAYAKIFNDWYRDPNLDTELDLDENLEGNVSAQSVGAGLFNLQRRGWEKDYFTSCLPFAQRGTEVLMPLSGVVDIEYAVPASQYAAGTLTAGDVKLDAFGTFQDAASKPIGIQNIEAATFQNSNVSINDFATSLAIQRWLENNARGGARYIEQIKGHFGVTVPDYRLQRTEYLGGGKQRLSISQVLSTADAGDSVVGDMRGHGVSVGRTNTFHYRCLEHGFIMGIMSIMPRSGYSQGVNRLWTRLNKYDFAFPEFAHLGEQAVFQKEIFFTGDAADDAEQQEVFGYLPRFAEYKFVNDRIAGDFRTSLEFWHLNRKFTSRPVLDSAFLQMRENDTALEESYRRIFAVQDGTDYIWIQGFHDCGAKRPLPYFGVPKLFK